MQPTYCFHCFARMGEQEQVCQHCGTRKGHLVSLKRWLLVSSLLILLTVGLFEGAWWLYAHNIYASYQPARCTIISSQVQYTSGSDYSYESPAFTYTVSAPGGYKQVGSDYDGPAHRNFVLADNAQAIVNHYVVGRTYNCWYSPIGQPSAVLVLQDYQNNWLNFWLTLLGIMFLFIPAVGLYAMYRSRLLRKRGVTTKGVVKTEVTTCNGYTQPVSFLVYQLPTDPPLEYRKGLSLG
nr:DUF3592 domain-containing protein [Chloroflexota bacterium]